jgi:Domain of unknown function (DUF4342)
MSDQTPETKEKKTLTEELEVAGNQAVERVKELVSEGNVRRLIIKNTDDNVLIEMPLTVGAVAGGAIVLAAPWLAALGAFAALVARVKIEIVREVDSE